MTTQNEISKMLTKVTFIKAGSQIKINRKHRGMTIPRLAKLAKVTSKRIRAIERGNFYNLKINTLIRIAHAFDLCVDLRFCAVSDACKEANKLPSVVPTFEEESINVRFN